MIDVDNTQPEDYHNDQEPDMKEYAQVIDKAFGNPMQQIDDMIDGLGFDSDSGYDEYKETRAGLL